MGGDGGGVGAGGSEAGGGGGETGRGGGGGGAAGGEGGGLTVPLCVTVTVTGTEITRESPETVSRMEMMAELVPIGIPAVRILTPILSLSSVMVLVPSAPRKRRIHPAVAVASH